MVNGLTSDNFEKPVSSSGCAGHEILPAPLCTQLIKNHVTLGGLGSAESSPVASHAPDKASDFPPLEKFAHYSSDGFCATMAGHHDQSKKEGVMTHGDCRKAYCKRERRKETSAQVLVIRLATPQTS